MQSVDEHNITFFVAVAPQFLSGAAPKSCKHDWPDSFPMSKICSFTWHHQSMFQGVTWGPEEKQAQAVPARVGNKEEPGLRYLCTFSAEGAGGNYTLLTRCCAVQESISPTSPQASPQMAELWSERFSAWQGLYYASSTAVPWGTVTPFSVNHSLLLAATSTSGLGQAQSVDWASGLLALQPASNDRTELASMA